MIPVQRCQVIARHSTFRTFRLSAAATSDQPSSQQLYDAMNNTAWMYVHTVIREASSWRLLQSVWRDDYTVHHGTVHHGHDLTAQVVQSMLVCSTRFYPRKSDNRVFHTFTPDTQWQ